MATDTGKADNTVDGLAEAIRSGDLAARAHGSILVGRGRKRRHRHGHDGRDQSGHAGA